jgi:ABC-type branched-subunit amino acid transport system substrate-binding protein
LVSITPTGTLATQGSFAATSQTQTFLNLWAAADPLVYIDSDGNRSSVDSRSLYLVDCVLALAHAIQLSLNEFPFLDGVDFRHVIVDKLFKSVKFDGVTSFVSFDQNGDVQSQLFDVANLRRAGAYVVIGKADKTDTTGVDYSKVQWPDSSFGLPNQSRFTHFYS